MQKYNFLSVIKLQLDYIGYRLAIRIYTTLCFNITKISLSDNQKFNVPKL